MRKELHARLEAGRITAGPYGTAKDSGPTGAYRVMGPNGAQMLMLAADGFDPLAQNWEHVSVSLAAKRCPNWSEMCLAKELFWTPDEAVIQFHPPASVYVNCHPYTLHLWRHRMIEFPVPHPSLIGPKNDQKDQT